MLNIIVSVVAILITIFLVIGVHEFGHFLVARLAGVKVLQFSIGFGKALYRWRDKKGTEYILAAIPLGGYVKMLDEGEEPVAPEETHLAFNRQPFYKKFAIIAAGPLFNLLFAFFIYWGLFVVGFVSIAPVIGKITPLSISAQAGLKPEQEIIKIDNQPTHNWITVIVNMLARAGDKDTMSIQVKNASTNALQNFTVNLSNWQMNDLKPDPLASMGITPYEPVIPAVIGNIFPDSPAAASGLQVGDKITAINGTAIKDWYGLVSSMIGHPNQTLSFTVERGKKSLVIPVKIGYKRNLLFQEFGFLGMSPAFSWPAELLHQNQYGPIRALSYAWRDLTLFVHLNFIVLGKMLTGKISLQSLGGPITIFESAGTALNNGIIAFFSFLAFLSISIGVINVIPIPGLDGGHLLFQTIERISRRPLSLRVQVLLQQFGFIFLFVIIIQAVVNDILRL